MRSTVEELAHELLLSQRAALGARQDAPVATQTWFKPRPLSDWTDDHGNVMAGHEADGLAFPPRVLGEPALYAVIGERRYSDGRWFLDFGVRPEWIEANTDYRFVAGRSDNPVWVCPDCEAIDGAHTKISLPDPDGGKPTVVRCPRDPAKRSWGGRS